MALSLITYADKSNVNPVSVRAQEATAEDFNEIKTRVNAAIAAINSSSLASNVYKITMPSAATVAARVALTTPPVGWILAAGSSPVDLDITHSLSKRVVSVTVFAVTGTEEQQLFNTAAYNGVITPDVNNLRIQSLATIMKEIVIYIVFEQ